MQTAAKSNLFLIDCSSLKVLADLQNASRQAEFYQLIAQELIEGVYTKQALRSLARRLINLAHNAYTIRKMDIVEQASQMLIYLPLSNQYRKIGFYYQALYLKRQGMVAEARTLLEGIENKVPHQYRGRVIMSLASLEYEASDFDSALPLYAEAGRAAYDRNWCDWFTALTTQRMLAVLKSIDGNHHGALADLENQFPLIRAISSFHPSLYYGYLNSLAVELGEVGRFEEAQNVCRIILASSFANTYPEVRETSNEIALRGYRLSRSVVSFALKPAPDNVLQLPDRCLSSGQGNYTPSPLERKASVVNLENWKKKMGKKPKNGEDKKLEPLEDMTRQDMAMNILEIITHNSEDEIKLRKLLEYARELYSKPDKADK